MSIKIHVYHHIEIEDLEEIMADIGPLVQAVNDLTTAVNAAVVELGNAGAPSQSQLDNVTSQVQTLTSVLTAAESVPVPSPVPAPTPAPTATFRPATARPPAVAQAVAPGVFPVTRPGQLRK